MLVPEKIGDQVIKFKAQLDESCTHTRNCVHSFNGKELGAAIWVAITEPTNLGTCKLFMCYPCGALTDTEHDSIQDAKEQAEWEYDGISNNWVTAI